MPQPLWDLVKSRQKAIQSTTATLRSAVKRNGRLPRHVLSGLLSCEQCGGTFKRLNGRGEYGCASHMDGGAAACTNGIRLPGALAEQKLLDDVAGEMLSPESVALLERKVREHLKAGARAPKTPPKAVTVMAARKSRQRSSSCAA